MKYTWQHNASTGVQFAEISQSRRLVRQPHSDGVYLYRVEEWGDYSLRFPIKSGWFSTPRRAIADLPRAIEESQNE